MDGVIYKFVEMDNGDIFLKRINNDIFNGYDIIPQHNNNILCKKKEIIKVDCFRDAIKYDYKKSVITFCSINNNEIDKLRYKNILRHIYEIVSDGATIIKYSHLNIKTVKKTSDGFYYIDDLGISVQGVDANKSILEIITQCINNDIEITINISLYDGVELCVEL